MKPNRPVPDVTLSEAEVKAVLERAVRIERRGATSVAELSEAAREAGIPEAAVLEAVAEVVAERNRPAAVTEPAVAPAARPARARWLTPMGFAAAGGIAGMFGSGLGALGLGLVGIGIGFRAFDHRRDRDFRQYELEATAGLGSWAAAAIVIGLPDVPTAEVVAVFGMMWAAFSAVGAGIIATGRRALHRADPGLPAAPDPTPQRIAD